ncbi:hypothetical protein [Pleurocapsa sp. PCC 7319]|uniref:hypothetical protein n=1 Tax=Pleurocapsa sp. PCC 7319 TaxID=118161 RepID=UPI00035F8504|nr:hypothetical protein [Pleurocapsa sp. PCC 7319]
MKKQLVSQLYPRMIMTSLLAVVLVPTQSAAAGDLLRDIGIGAATNVVTGEVLNNGSTVGNAVKGAATGAAVSATHDRNNNSVGGTIQDAGIGAATNVVTGEIINDDSSVGENAVTGAATGALINIFK